MTTLEPEQKDILEKLNEVALEANWGTADRVDGVPKAIAVIQEAMEEIKFLRDCIDIKQVLGDLYGFAKLQGGITASEILNYADACGVTLDEKNS